MVPEDGDFIFAEALRPKSFMASPSTSLRRSRLHVDKFDVSACICECLVQTNLRIEHPYHPEQVQSQIPSTKEGQEEHKIFTV